ncbi:MAG TPA: SUMF1/EgtB/PvdO family nonheme iron enzyme [Ktedonobacterales bacterium]|nr:SUMF1/EgtB/PvdO family nonheme iron enzyme [Ktedonobacterales bacterium]
MTTPARPGRVPDPIFVSHSHKDNEWCREFIATLTAAGWSVWYDEQGLHGGAAWLTVIEKELSARPIVMLIITPDALASEWVQRELQLAMLERKQILPVLHKDTPQVGGFLKLIQWINVVGLPAPIAAARVAQEMGYPLDGKNQPSSPPLPPPSRSLPPDNRFPKRLADLGYTALPSGDDIVIIPPLCDIPAGPFVMGSDKRRDIQAYDDELPTQTIALPAYQIARHPVTVAEYACAVRGRARPEGAIRDQLERMDHPIVNVSWHDAMAYVQWLSERTGKSWQLPTEAEWEKAARGTDGRIYPWGDRWDTTRANTRESGFGRTSSVGNHSNGTSPYRVQEMAGNVWEWTSSSYKPYPYHQTVSEDGGRDNEAARVLRGGSWYLNSRNARVACRSRLDSNVRAFDRGFRMTHHAAPDQT